MANVLPAYSEVVEALTPIMRGLPGVIVTIDGRGGVGKTTLGRYLAWHFNVTLIETDLFLIPARDHLFHLDDQINRIIERRIMTPLPVIVEGVSMLEAKHLQNHPLYRGQEASARFLPFDKAEFIVPRENPAGRAYVEKLRAFYIKARPVMVAVFAKKNGVDMDAVPEKDENGKLTKK